MSKLINDEVRSEYEIPNVKSLLIDNERKQITDIYNEENHSVVATKLYSLEKQIEEKNKEIDRLNNIIEEIENTIENFMENHTEGYIDWKYDREIYLAESNVLQKLYDTYFDKLQELKENNNG